MLAFLFRSPRRLRLVVLISFLVRGDNFIATSRNILVRASQILWLHMRVHKVSVTPRSGPGQEWHVTQGD